MSESIPDEIASMKREVKAAVEDIDDYPVEFVRFEEDRYGNLGVVVAFDEHQWEVWGTEEEYDEYEDDEDEDYESPRDRAVWAVDQVISGTLGSESLDVSLIGPYVTYTYRMPKTQAANPSTRKLKSKLLR